VVCSRKKVRFQAIMMIDLIPRDRELTMTRAGKNPLEGDLGNDSMKWLR